MKHHPLPPRCADSLLLWNSGPRWQQVLHLSMQILLHSETNTVKTLSSQSMLCPSRGQSSPHEGAATEISDSSKGGLLTALFRVPFAFHVHFMYNQQSYRSLQSIQYDMGLGKLFILPKSQFDSSSVGLMIMPCSISVRINKVTHTECRMVLGTW